MDSVLSEPNNVDASNSSDGIQFLLDSIYGVLGNPLLMFDLDYKLVGNTNNIVTDDPLWNELLVTGSYGNETIEFFRNEYFIDAAANTKTIAFLASDKLKYDRLLGKIYNRDHIAVANVHLVACNKPFSDGDPGVFEAFCQTLSDEVCKNDFFQRYGEAHQDALIGKLIGGGIEDRRYYSAHMANIYDGLKDNLYLAVADISQYNQEADLTHFRDLFKRAQPAFKYSIYSKYIAIIIGLDGTRLKVEKDLPQLKPLLGRYNIYAGISGCFENLFELQRYYEEAVTALNCGLKNSRRILLYEDINAVSD